MKIIFIALLGFMSLFAAEEPIGDITAYSRFTVHRSESNAPDIICYFSRTQNENYPIAIVCDGATTINDIRSVTNLHRHFLTKFISLGCSFLTLEQWGVDGDTVNVDEFKKHYTRTQRLQDHRTIINHLKAHTPQGWNGKIILFGVSEGGPLVTTLTADFPEDIIATVNWPGAIDCPWSEVFWVFTRGQLNQECPHHKVKVQECECSADYVTRKKFDQKIDRILSDPDPNKEWFGLPYKYHADAFSFPQPDFSKIKTPILVICGAKDECIGLSDTFVAKLRAVGVDVTHLRIEDMGHDFRKREDVLNQAFVWLEKLLIR